MGGCMKRILVLLALLMLLTGCRPEQYTKTDQVSGFIVLDNGNVEFAAIREGRIYTVVLSLEDIYPYEGESKIIETSYDYYNVYAYLSEEDYENLQEKLGK